MSIKNQLAGDNNCKRKAHSTRDSTWETAPGINHTVDLIIIFIKK